MAGVWAWPIPLAMYGFCGGLAGVVGPVGCHEGVVGYLGSYGCRGGVACDLGPVWPPWGVAGPVGPGWPPWGRSRTPGPPWGRNGCPKPRMATVGAWQIPWSQYGPRGDVAGPLGPAQMP